MKTPKSHKGWMILISSFNDDTDKKWANECINEIYPDFKDHSTIHRTKCDICNGNIIKFDEILFHKINYADISEQTYEFHYKNCVRKQKLLKIKKLC